MPLVIDEVLDDLDQRSPSSSPGATLRAPVLRATLIPIHHSLLPTAWAPLIITGIILKHPMGTALLALKGTREDLASFIVILSHDLVGFY